MKLQIRQGRSWVTQIEGTFEECLAQFKDQTGLPATRMVVHLLTSAPGYYDQITDECNRITD